MVGVTASIFWKDAPLFSYGVIIITVCYIILSFAHPDYWIARYDLSRDSDRDYLYKLSADAAPAILDPSINPELVSVEDMLEKTSVDQYGNYNTDDYYENYWMKKFYCDMEDDTRFLGGIRNFNFSLYRAKKYL